jgi:hypothetical protein
VLESAKRGGESSLKIKTGSSDKYEASKVEVQSRQAQSFFPALFRSCRPSWGSFACLGKVSCRINAGLGRSVGGGVAGDFVMGVCSFPACHAW